MIIFQINHEVYSETLNNYIIAFKNVIKKINFKLLCKAKLLVCTIISLTRNIIVLLIFWYKSNLFLTAFMNKSLCLEYYFFDQLIRVFLKLIGDKN